ncbi:MAG: TIGR00269 family protein [Candidatus Diapherotrites archaeon]
MLCRRNLSVLNMSKCVKCAKQAKISLAYGPHRFCAEHFNEFFEKRVFKTVRENKLLGNAEKCAVGLSGGKDSTAALFLLQKLFAKTNPIEAVMVDEGIKGYRDKALKIAKKNCEEWRIPFTVVDMKKELGYSMTDVFKKISKNEELGSSCSFCGVFRRRLLNKGALAIGADKTATGHNLDDEAQSIVMNFFESDLRRLSRLGPIVSEKKSKKLVPRIKPLYESPENEILAFCSFNGLKHYSEECCPFSWQAKRNEFRSTVDSFEEKFPGTKFKLLASFRQLKPLLEKSFAGEKFNYCAKCGEPTSARECRSCSKLDALLKH